MLERGEMKRELPSSSTHSGGEDTEDEEEEEEESEAEEDDCDDTGVTTPPVSPPSEQPFTPPHMASHLESDPIGNNHDDEFIDISALDQLGDQSLSDFDIDVSTSTL
jgi:hypothetical protein